MKTLKKEISKRILHHKSLQGGERFITLTFKDEVEMYDLLSLVAEKQRTKDHKHFGNKHGGHCNSGDVILDTPLVTDNLKEK